jgi:hypothetical protein
LDARNGHNCVAEHEPDALQDEQVAADECLEPVALKEVRQQALAEFQAAIALPVGLEIGAVSVPVRAYDGLDDWIGRHGNWRRERFELVKQDKLRPEAAMKADNIGTEADREREICIDVIEHDVEVRPVIFFANLSEEPHDLVDVLEFVVAAQKIHRPWISALKREQVQSHVDWRPPWST